MRVALPVAVLALVAVVVLLHHVLLRRPLPRIAGTIEVAGLRAHLDVVRDRDGVPHIRARTMQDAAFAVGLVHAQDRGWQLELMRRVATGRLAEVAGADAVEADRLVRRLGIARVAAAEAAMLEGESREMLEAYAAGVDAVLRAGAQPRPLELFLARVAPEPWRSADSLAIARLIGLGLACDWDFELQRLRLLEAVGPSLAAMFDMGYPPENPTILAETLATSVGLVPAEAAEALRARYDALAAWLPAGARAAASNSWVLDGSMTATGRPLLCNDPHLPPSVPSIWYQLHVDVEGDLAAAGVGFPGLPFVVIGHNRRLAWGFTNSFANVQDLVLEEVDGEAGTRVRTEAGWEDAVAIDEVVRVRGGADVVEGTLATRHGPVVERFVGRDGVHRALALQWSALHPDPDVVGGLLALQRSDGWESFRDAVARFNIAPQNAVYADVDGHIGYVLAGPVPVRPGPASRLPLTGWDADRRFQRMLRPDELPQVLDPPSHLVVTANNRVVGDGFPHHIGFDSMNGYRALRIGQLLQGRSGVDAALMQRVQMDIVSPAAQAVTMLLEGVHCRDALAEQARRALVAWNGAMTPEATEPTVYAAFVRELTRAVVEPHCGAAWTLVAGEMTHPLFGHAGNITGRLTPWLLDRWRRGDADLLGGRGWPDVAAAAMEAAVASLRRDHGRLSRWRWGRLHQLPLEHALGQRRLLGLLFNQHAVEVGGDTDTVHQTAWEPGVPYRSRGWAPSWRMVLDVGSWDDAAGIMYPGQSGHPGSRHYRDLTEDWRRNRQHPMAWSTARVDALASARLHLRPRDRAAAAAREAA